jgi:PAS domain-containing protein
MALALQGYQRSRLVRVAAGLVALFLLVGRLQDRRHIPSSVALADAFIWATTLIVAVMLLWRERNHAVANRQSNDDHARFIAAAETSPDAFFIFDSVRNPAGDIVDFRFKYVNTHGEELLRTPRAQLLNHDLCELFPINRTAGFFDKYRKVVQTGVALSEEFPLPLDGAAQMWLRHRVVRLGDGVAITTTDASEIKASEERYRSLSNFSNSVFETAPFSIIETNRDGVIQAMNAAS